MTTHARCSLLTARLLARSLARLMRVLEDLTPDADARWAMLRRTLARVGREQDR